MNEKVTANPSVSRKVKQKRPDGSDLDRYKDIEKWSYRKWAWEFLRRNRKFIDACKKADLGNEEEKQAVADEFELKKYKPFSEGYKGESGIPRFLIGAIRSWTHVDHNQGERRVVVKLDSGQLLIRFDLPSAMQDSKILEKQLRLAEIRLKTRLKEYEKAINGVAHSHAHKVSKFGQYLVLLDAYSAGKSKAECGLLISPKKAKRVESGDLERFETDPASHKKVNKAIEYSEELYRYLAVLKGKPCVKHIPLNE